MFLVLYISKMLGTWKDSREAEWNRESQWVSALAAGGARGEFEAEGSRIMAVVGVHYS